MIAPTPLNSPDAMLVPVDPTAVSRLVEGLDLCSEGIGEVRPDWSSDLVWLSPADERHFKLFEQMFEALGIADHVRDRLDLRRAPRLYSGFILRRSRCDAAHFHTDWRGCQGQAYTFITAIDEASEGFGLLYRDCDGTVVSYDYRPGEGILFGDDFSHSTRPGARDEPLTLLCFEFGTDRMHYWPKIFGCIEGQSLLLRRPDGKIVLGRRARPLLGRLLGNAATRLPRLARAIKSLLG